MDNEMDSVYESFEVVRLTGVRAAVDSGNDGGTDSGNDAGTGTRAERGAGESARFRADVTLYPDDAASAAPDCAAAARAVADVLGGGAGDGSGDGPRGGTYGGTRGGTRDADELARDAARRVLDADVDGLIRAVEVTVHDSDSDVGVPCDGIAATVVRVRETDDADDADGMDGMDGAADTADANDAADDSDAAADTAASPLPAADGAANHRRAVISMDSTSTDAERLFRESIVALEGVPGTQVEGISPLYHVSNFDGPDAMAAVIQIDTTLGARALVGTLGTIERSLEGEGNIDLDLIDMDGVSLDEPDCRVPWPSAREHAAVLAPWMDMDPNATFDGDPVSFLLAMAPDAARVGLLSDNWILGGGAFGGGFGSGLGGDFNADFGAAAPGGDAR